VLREPGLAARLAAGGRRTVEAHYDWRKVYRAWDEVYGGGGARERGGRGAGEQGCGGAEETRGQGDRGTRRSGEASGCSRSVVHRPDTKGAREREGQGAGEQGGGEMACVGR